MKEIVQSVYDLHYFLLRFKDKTQKKKIIGGLTILKEKEINFQGSKMTLAIIGESHYLLWGDYMEILSCIPINNTGQNLEILLNQRGRVIDKKSLSKKIRLTDFGRNGDYNINFKFRKISDLNRKRITKLNDIYKERRGNGYYTLVQKFPGVGNPATYLWVKIYRNSISLITCHTYPNENMTAWTQSKLKVRS